MLPRLSVTICFLSLFVSIGCTDFAFLNVVPSELPAPALKFEQSYSPAGFGCVVYPLSPAEASVYSLEGGEHVVEMAVFEPKAPFLQLSETVMSMDVLSKRQLAPRYLSANEIEAFQVIMESIEIIEEVGFTEFCASDPCGGYFFTLDDKTYSSHAGLCPNGPYQYIDSDSQDAILSYLASLAN